MAVDYSEVAKAVDEMREMARAMVAGFIADGFSPEQARTITAGCFASIAAPKKED